MAEAKLRKAMELAFNSREASKACIALAKLFLKNNEGYDFDTIVKETKYDRASLWFTLDRLIREAKIVETFPDFKNVKSTSKGKEITYKFKLRPQYKPLLKQYA